MAAAEMLAIPSSDTGDDVSIYQLKWVEWKEEFAPIVVQVISFRMGAITLREGLRECC